LRSAILGGPCTRGAPDSRPPASESAPEARTEGSIEVVGLSKDFGRRGRAGGGGLRPLTFRVAPGEVAALVGPNGSGKTTALRILATLVEPTAGRAFVCGRDAAREPVPVKSLIGLSLASGRSFYWRLTAGQNLAFFARLAHVTGRSARERIRGLASELGLEAALGEPARRLSRGTLAKLSVARALLHAPPVVLLDEPLASVDAGGREAIVRTLRRAAAGGAAVLVTAQEPPEGDWCDRLYDLPPR
jgi:ABC-type multidrug transport system ATPase subunit